MTEYIYPQSVFVGDKMGNILVGEMFKMDIRFKVQQYYYLSRRASFNDNSSINDDDI
jgi:hypothetical protein